MKKFLRHAIQMLSSNIITLLVGLLSTFIVPHVLSKYGFGMYRMFYLYTSYVAFLHFGFIDGILLVHSGDDYNDLNKYKFRSYSKIFIFIQLILSVIILTFAILSTMPVEIKKLIISLSIYSFVINITNYYQYISKSILRFTELSLITTIQALCNMFFIVVSILLFFTKLIHISFEYYIFSTIFVYGFIMIIYIYKYRDLTFGRGDGITNSLPEIIKYMKKGLLFTITYQLLVFMINIDNQFILGFFSTVTYSEYSFTYSMALLVTTFFGTLSGLLLPYMRKKNEKFLIKNHDNIITVMFLIVFLLLLTYIPLKFVVIGFFPKYIYSLNYAIYIFPGLVYSCIVESFIFNSFLFFNKIRTFFTITLFNIIFSSFILYLTYLFTNSSYALAAISIILLFVWYISLEIYLRFCYGVKIIKTTIYSIIIIACFIMCMKLTNYVLVNGIVYFILYVFVSFYMFKRTISNYSNLIRDSKNDDK